jgi:GNAT superfamily N-acetyltransferase
VRERFLAQIHQKEVFLAKIGNDVVGTITLQWSDPVFWNGASSDAGYIHKFAVVRAYAGRKIGEEMLRWAERQALMAGKNYLRLDCLASNSKIRAYYEKAGYIHKGETSPTGWRASLYEKPLSG